MESERKSRQLSPLAEDGLDNPGHDAAKEFLDFLDKSQKEKDSPPPPHDCLENSYGEPPIRPPQ